MVRSEEYEKGRSPGIRQKSDILPVLVWVICGQLRPSGVGFWLFCVHELA